MYSKCLVNRLGERVYDAVLRRDDHGADRLSCLSSSATESMGFLP
jgi:hypothetical protein